MRPGTARYFGWLEEAVPGEADKNSDTMGIIKRIKWCKYLSGIVVFPKIDPREYLKYII
jgi:hypothetical protein